MNYCTSLKCQFNEQCKRFQLQYGTDLDHYADYSNKLKQTDDTGNNWHCPKYLPLSTIIGYEEINGCGVYGRGL